MDAVFSAATVLLLVPVLQLIANTSPSLIGHSRVWLIGSPDTRHGPGLRNQ